MRSVLFLLTVVVALTGACGNSTPPSTSRPAPASDLGSREQNPRLSSEIEESLANNGLRKVDVRAQSDQVILSGYVDSDEDKIRAEQIVRGKLPGLEIHNLITVSKGPPIDTSKPGGPSAKPINTNKSGGPRVKPINTNRSAGARH